MSVTFDCKAGQWGGGRERLRLARSTRRTQRRRDHGQLLRVLGLVRSVSARRTYDRRKGRSRRRGARPFVVRRVPSLRSATAASRRNEHVTIRITGRKLPSRTVGTGVGLLRDRGGIRDHHRGRNAQIERDENDERTANRVSGPARSLLRTARSASPRSPSSTTRSRRNAAREHARDAVRRDPGPHDVPAREQHRGKSGDVRRGHDALVVLERDLPHLVDVRSASR